MTNSDDRAPAGPWAAGDPPAATFVSVTGVRTLPGDGDDRRRLPERTARYWRTRALLVGVPILAAAIFGALRFHWFTPTVSWIIVGVLAGWLIVVEAVIAPPVRRALFWYSLSDTEIDIQHGWLVRTRTVVPMSRVQHLKTEQGVLADRFRVANLHIHTAAGPVRLAGLDVDEAADVRARIGALAQLADDV